jgi:hypothetical protein
MGYLTTITIYNDGLDQIEKNPKEFTEKTCRACLGVYSRNDGSENSFGVGNHGNLVTVQAPRHMDDSTIYVHMGNTVCEMNAYSMRTSELMQHSTQFFDKMLKEMEEQVKLLKKRRKEWYYVPKK